MKFKKTDDGLLVIDEAGLDEFVTDVVKTTTEKTIKEAGLLTPQAPTIITAAVTAAATRKELSRTVKFFKALAEQDWMSIKALSEGSMADGGYLIPIEFAQEILMGLEAYGIARQYSTIHTMKTNEKRLNSLASSVVAYWTDEATDINESAPVFGEPKLTCHKLAGLTVWTSELFEDAEVGILDTLAKLFVEAFGYQEDDQWFNGNTNPFVGLYKVSGCQDTTLDTTDFTGLMYDKVLDAIASLSPGALAGATPKWFMHRTVLAKFRGIKDDNNMPIMVDPRGALPGTILGYEVVLSERSLAASSIAAATKFCGFGNPKPWVHFGDRKQITTKILTEATIGSVKLAQSDQEAIRLIERVATTWALPAKMARMVTAAA